MKSIQKIIASEGVTKVNNVNIRKEAGDYGTSGQISDDGSGNIIFSTDYSIEEVVYVAIEGDVMIPVEEYSVTGTSTIQVMPGGAAPAIGTNIFVCYLRARGAFTVGAGPTIQFPPTIDTLFLNPQTGGIDLTKFNFTIIANDGLSISWKLFKNQGGINTEIFTGVSLNVIDGALTVAGPEQIVYDMTAADQDEGEVSFVLQVAYTILDSAGTSVPGTIAGTTIYVFDPVSPITGTVTVLPDEVTVSGSINVTATYNISNLSAQIIGWRLIRNTAPEGFPNNNVVLDSGTINTSISDVFNESFIIEDWTQDIQYTLEFTNDPGAINPAYAPLSSDTIITNLIIPIGLSSVGYEDAANILVETSPGSGVYVPISTEAEYNTNVNQANYTKTVSNVYLTNSQFLEAPVPAFGISVQNIYFMMEIPDTWGDVIFYNTLGDINMSEFTVIDLPFIGSKAYIYTAGTSTPVNPVDFKIKNL